MWGRRRQEEIFPEQLQHFAQQTLVQTVEAVLGSLLLPEPGEDVTLLLSKGASNADNLAKLAEVMSHLLLADVAVLVEERETEVAEDVLFDVTVELDQAVALVHTLLRRWRRGLRRQRNL